MAIMMIMRWDGVTEDVYEAVRKESRFETDIPDGAMFHVASFGDGALHVTDVWESAEKFNAFIGAHVAPVAERLGIKGQPDVAIFPMHNVFNPGVAKQ
jgi:hypothetical protein